MVFFRIEKDLKSANLVFFVDADFQWRRVVSRYLRVCRVGLMEFHKMGMENMTEY